MLATSTITKMEKSFWIQEKSLVRIWLPKAGLSLFFFLSFLGSAWPSPLLSEPPSTLSFSLHNQQFSAHIIHVPLEHVLTTLISYKHFRFTIKGNAKDDVISTSFLHLSLLESLERLLLGYDYAIIQHRLDSTSSPPQFPSLMEVVILSRNSAQPLSREARPSWVSSPQTSTQPVLLRANQILKQPNRTKPLDFMSEHGTSDIQAMGKEALQDSDPTSRSLIEELLKE